MKTQRRPASRLGTHSGSWSASWVPGQFQAQDSFSNAYSVAFDGIDDYATLGVSDEIITSDIFSLSMWFKIGDTSGGAKRIFVSNRSGGGTNLRVDVRTSGVMSVRCYNGSGLGETAGGSAIDDDDWHHMVFTTTASAQALYIDGSSVATSSNTFSNDADGTYYGTTIAVHISTGVYAAMSADEVATFAGTALSAGDVTTIYNSGIPGDISSLNPTGWWRMGDNNAGTGINVPDEGSGDSTAVLTNGPTYSGSVPS